MFRKQVEINTWVKNYLQRQDSTLVKYLGSELRLLSLGGSCHLLGASLGAQTVKTPPAVQENGSSIPGSGRSSGEGNGNPLQYSCLENSMDRGVWRATVHGVAKFT